MSKKQKKLACPTHSKFDGATKPRGNCFTCWRIWLRANPEGQVTIAQLRRALAGAYNAGHADGYDLRVDDLAERLRGMMR